MEQKQWEQRLLDLQSRYLELEELGAPYRGWQRLTRQDLWYASPISFETLGDVERAMALILKALETPKHQPTEKKTEVLQENKHQISLFEGIPPFPNPLQAA